MIDRTLTITLNQPLGVDADEVIDAAFVLVRSFDASGHVMWRARVMGDISQWELAGVLSQQVRFAERDADRWITREEGDQDVADDDE